MPVNDQGDAYKLLYPFGWQVISLETQPSTVCRVPSNPLDHVCIRVRQAG